MIKNRNSVVILLLFFGSSSLAKEPPHYLSRVYSDSDYVAYVAVVGQIDVSDSQVKYELHILKKIKGSAEKNIEIVLAKHLPAESPHLAEGDVGVAFLKKKEGLKNVYSITLLSGSERSIKIEKA